MSFKRLAKSAANGVLNRFGLELRRVQKLRGRMTKASALKTLGALGLNPHTVIDVGVYHGTPELYEAFPEALHVLVEPLAECKPQIERIRKGIQRSLVIQAAASNRSGQEMLSVRRGVTHAVLGEQTAASWDPSLSRSVQLVTLDEIADTHRIRGPYVVKVDVDGPDLDVLEGASRVLKETACIVLESTAWDLGRRIQFLDRSQFFLWDCVDAAYKAGVFYQADLIFLHNEYKRQPFLPWLDNDTVLAREPLELPAA